MGTPHVDAGHSDLDPVLAVAALADPTRRALYTLVSDATEPVTREHAAGRVGISRKLAAFHLDKLIDAGLLVAVYHPSQRTRTLGRVPKAYRRAEVQADITIPDRRPAELAALLLDGIATARPGEPALDAVLRAAETAGRDLGAATRARTRPGRLGADRALTLAESALRERAYQPWRESATSLRLRNCPFQPLAAHATELVCALNQRLLSGFVTGLQTQVAHAVLAPRPGECCVELRASAEPGYAARSIDTVRGRQ